MSLNYSEDCDQVYSSNESLDENEDYKEELRNRINQLRGTMLELKTQLKNEKDNWEREIQQLSNSENNLNQADIVTSSNDMSTTNSLQYIELQGFSMYEDPMNYINVESKNLQRQLAISNYRRRLLEVENMCNLELMRVKQNVTFLQPLRLIASEWESNKEPNESGESLNQASKTAEYSLMEEKNNKINELTHLELINNKFAGDMANALSKVYPDSNDILTTTKSNKSKYQNDDTKFQSTWCNDYLTTEQNY
ncbi:hypothetical protein QE152_g31886 [Popillia japonica]|uniref:Uncharacterized protein n=1 Tax=Popillia japonica TaxID=7064 RepID=A0AAW1J1M3_POPJA